MNTDRVRSIVRRFGSQEALASKLGIAQTTVSAWVRNGCIPSRRIGALLAVARREGIELSADELFSIEDDGLPERRAP